MIISPIKFLLLAVIALILTRMFFRFRSKDISSVQFYGWLAVWLLGITVIVFPNITTYLADKAGLGRGVDLVIYTSIILGYYLIFKLFVYLGRVEKELTALVRAQALRESEEYKKKNDLE